MTGKRIAQLRRLAGPSVSAWDFIHECLDEIVLLQKQIKDANKAIKLAAKGRKPC